MKGIAEFFERIRGLQMRKVRIYTILRDAIRKVTGIEVPLGSIAIKNGVATLRPLDPGARSVMFIKKESILRELNKDYNEVNNSGQIIQSISDIRW